MTRTMGKLKFGIPSNKSRKEGHGRCSFCRCKPVNKALMKTKGTNKLKQREFHDNCKSDSYENSHL